jgi:hypothetical protein
MVEQFVHNPMNFYSKPQDSLVEVKKPVVISAPTSYVYDAEKKDLNKAMDNLEGSIDHYAQYTAAAEKPSNTLSALADDKKMVKNFVDGPSESDDHPKQSLAEVKNPFGD